MKFLFLNGLLLVVGKTLAQGVLVSGECTAEIGKYQSCVDGLETTSFSKPEEAVAFCKSIDEKNECKNFRDDALKSESACISLNNTKLMDMATGLKYYSIKLPYLVYCSKGKDGNLCPFSQYLQNSINSTKGSDLNTLQENALLKEDLKTLSDDCKDEKCNSRMLAVNDIVKIMSTVNINLSKASGKSKSTDNTDDVNEDESQYLSTEFFTFYKNKECSKFEYFASPASSDNPLDKLDSNSNSSSGGSSFSSSGNASENTSDVHTAMRISYPVITFALLVTLLLI